MATFRPPARPAPNALRNALAGALLGALIAAPSAAAAQSAKASGTVSVTISGPVSAIARATGIRFSTIGLPGAAPGGATPDAADAAAGMGGLSLSESGLAAGGGSMPGSFTVSGDKLQAFSISLPDRVILDVNGILLELRAFRHSGGTTPSTGPDGSTQIAFTADVNRDQLEIFRQVAVASAAAGTIFLEIPADAIASQGIAVAGDDGEPAQAQIVEARRPNPFGAPDPSAKMVFVLISYN